MKYLSSILIVALVLLLPLLSGCGGPQSTMRYYQLAATEVPSVPELNKNPSLALGVGPVMVSEILKRQEIVIRGKGNQYHLYDEHRWAGLLEKDMTAVLIENLEGILGTEQILAYPWGAYFEPDYRVLIEVHDLSGSLGGQVTLRASWSLVDNSGVQVLARRIGEYQQQAGDSSVDALIQAENELLARFCLDVASSISNLK
jgi:uncharacterized protein